MTVWMMPMKEKGMLELLLRIPMEMERRITWMRIVTMTWFQTTMKATTSILTVYQTRPLPEQTPMGMAWMTAMKAVI